MIALLRFQSLASSSKRASGSSPSFQGRTSFIPARATCEAESAGQIMRVWSELLMQSAIQVERSFPQESREREKAGRIGHRDRMSLA